MRALQICLITASALLQQPRCAEPVLAESWRRARVSFSAKTQAMCIA